MRVVVDSAEVNPEHHVRILEALIAAGGLMEVQAAPGRIRNVRMHTNFLLFPSAHTTCIHPLILSLSNLDKCFLMVHCGMILCETISFGLVSFVKSHQSLSALSQHTHMQLIFFFFSACSLFFKCLNIHL